LTETAAPSAVRRIASTDLIMLGVVLIWGVNFSAVKYALGGLAPLTFNTLRFGVATVVLVVIMRLRGESFWLRRQDLLPVILLGFGGHTLYQALFINGMARTTPAIAALLMATSPLFVVIYGMLLGLERPRLAVITGIILSFIGMLLLIIGGQDGLALLRGAGGEINLRRDLLVGDLLILLAAMMWAAYTLGGKPLLGRYSPLKLNALTMIPGTLLLALLSAPTLAGQDWGAVSAGAWGAWAYSTTFAVVVAYVLWYTSVQRVGGARTAIYSNLTPVVATAVSWLLLGERLAPLQIIGAAIVIVGILLARRHREPAAQR
jgi:drug/metabolite transporter (DMT)-like permease